MKTPKWKLPKLHENGINALCIDSARIAFTGGDDGSITISDLKEQKIRQKIPQCSAAHITGIETVNIDDCIKNLISVSVDQRITRWKIDKEDGNISVLHQGFSSVPDIHVSVHQSNDAGSITKWTLFCATPNHFKCFPSFLSGVHDAY